MLTPNCSRVRIAGGVVRGALGSWTAGTVAAASASDVDVSEAGAARAVRGDGGSDRLLGA